jgi:hypothetical protein
MLRAPEPKDKLDMATGQAARLADSTDNMNGPEDEVFDWAAIDWPTHEDNVGRLRQRIFKATQDGTSSGSAICRS